MSTRRDNKNEVKNLKAFLDLDILRDLVCLTTGYIHLLGHNQPVNTFALTSQPNECFFG